MKKVWLFIAVFGLSSLVAIAQKGDYVIDEKSNFMDRVYVGGGFGLSGGSNSTIITVSPMVGYMVSNRFSVGVGATYQYFKINNFTDNQYGGLLFARMNLFKQIFGYAEYSFINQIDYRDGVTRITIDRLPIGVGFSQRMGSRSSFNVIAAYDMLYDANGQYYDSPWVISFFVAL